MAARPFHIPSRDGGGGSDGGSGAGGPEAGAEGGRGRGTDNGPVKRLINPISLLSNLSFQNSARAWQLASFNSRLLIVDIGSPSR
jgi:hypothetical protein